METRDSRTGPSMVNTTGGKEFPAKCSNIVSDNFRCLGWDVTVLRNDFPVHCGLFWTLFDHRMIQIHHLLKVVNGFRNSWYMYKTETTECTWLSSFLNYSVLQSMYIDGPGSIDDFLPFRFSKCTHYSSPVMFRFKKVSLSYRESKTSRTVFTFPSVCYSAVC